jgi:hypothetical protein
MTATKILITATVLLLATPIVPALAHDDDDNGYARHEEFHDQLSAAHEEGFYSRAEHRASLRDLHGGYHDDEYGTSSRSYYVPYRSYYHGRPRFSGFWGW